MTAVPRWLLPGELAVLDGWPANRRTVRDWAIDLALFGFAVVVAVEQARVHPPEGVDFLPGWMTAVNPWAGAVACAGLWWRRRFPMVLAVVYVPLLVVSTSAVGAVMVVTLTLAVHRPWPRAAAMTAIYLLAVSYYALFSQPPGMARSVVVASALLLYAGPFCVGMAARARRTVIANLRREVALQQREHLVRLLDVRRAERERLAREMHDVLAHRISLLSVHAGALAYRTARAAAGDGPPLVPAEVGAAVEVIQDNARRALDELGEVLSVLRADEEPEPARPFQADIPRLIAEANAAGQRAHLTACAMESVREQVRRTAYRTVQEGLTNARKHAPGAPVSVSVEGEPGAYLLVTVDNPLPAVGPDESRPLPGSGSGLIGLAERVALHGGTLTSGPSDGRFRLTVRLPWQP